MIQRWPDKWSQKSDISVNYFLNMVSLFLESQVFCVCKIKVIEIKILGKAERVRKQYIISSQKCRFFAKITS